MYSRESTALRGFVTGTEGTGTFDDDEGGKLISELVGTVDDDDDDDCGALVGDV